MLAADTATISGKVQKSSRKIVGGVVVLIPESRGARQTERYTLRAETGASGQFQIWGVIPGNYFLFAVPPSDDQSYYALDFAERIRRNAKRVSIGPREARVFNLTASTND
jgi:hypothetical protein